MKTFIKQKLSEIHRVMVDGSISGNSAEMFNRFNEIRAEIIEAVEAAENMIDSFAECDS